MNERLKKVRKELKLTQQEFADKLGSKRNTIATYEMGRTEPSAAVVSLICKVFHVNETWLRTGEGEMFDLADDRTAAIVSGILEENAPTYELVLRILGHYQELDSASKAVLDEFVDSLIKSN